MNKLQMGSTCVTGLTLNNHIADGVILKLLWDRIPSNFVPQEIYIHCVPKKVTPKFKSL